MSKKVMIPFVFVFILLFFGALYIVPKIRQNPFVGTYTVSGVQGTTGKGERTDVPAEQIILQEDGSVVFNGSPNSKWEENGSGVHIYNNSGLDIDLYKESRNSLSLSDSGVTYIYQKKTSDDPFTFLSDIRTRAASLFSKDGVDAFKSVYTVGE